MNEPTEQELKAALARLLPDKIYYSDSFSGVNAWCWKTPPQNRVRDTEWLHIVHLIEEKLFSGDYTGADDYCCELGKLIVEQRKGVPASMDRITDWTFHASWQIRAKAILKIKGRG